MKRSVGLLALVTLLTASVAMAAAEDELMAADRAWAASAADVDTFMKSWAEGASFHAPGTPKLTGTEAIRAFLDDLHAMAGFHLEWSPTKAVVSKSGELGYTVGTYEMTLSGPDAKPTVEKGKYVTVWVKQDGQWKVMEDIFNSNMPK